MSRREAMLGIGAFLGLLSGHQKAKASRGSEISWPSNLEKLAIYYGWPPAANDQGAQGSIEVYSNFDDIVLGAKLELKDHPKRTDPAYADHPVHDVTEAITKILNNKPLTDKEGKEINPLQYGIRKPKKALKRTSVYGYVDLGFRCRFHGIDDHDLPELSWRIRSWAENIGVDGIFFDEASLTYMQEHLSREDKLKQFEERFGHVILECRKYGLQVFVNSDSPWLIIEEGSGLIKGDRVLLEPFGYSVGAVQPGKLSNPYGELQKKGVKVFGVGTCDTRNPKEVANVLPALIKYAVAAKLDGLSLADPVYSASEKSANFLYTPK